MVSPSFAASSILQQALKIFESRDHTATKVTSILVLVDFEHQTKIDEIKVDFFLQARGTACEKAQLRFEKAEAHLACRMCSKIFPYPDTKNPLGFTLNCPRCGSEDTQILTFEVMVKKIKIA